MQEDIIGRQDLVPSDYHLYGSIKEGLRGKHYTSDEEVKAEVMNWLKEPSTEFYQFKGRTLLLR